MHNLRNKLIWIFSILTVLLRLVCCLKGFLSSPFENEVEEKSFINFELWAFIEVSFPNSKDIVKHKWAIEHHSEHGNTGFIIFKMFATDKDIIWELIGMDIIPQFPWDRRYNSGLLGCRISVPSLSMSYKWPCRYGTIVYMVWRRNN